MALDYPNCVVYDVFSFQALHLQADIDVKSIVSACSDSRQHLDVSPQESVSGPWKRAKGNLIAPVRLAIEESELAIEHPLASLPERLIFTFQELRQLLKIDHGSVRSSDHMLVLIEQIAWEISRKLLREFFKPFSFLASVWALHRPLFKLSVPIKAILAEQVLYKGVQPAIVNR